MVISEQVDTDEEESDDYLPTIQLLPQCFNYKYDHFYVREFGVPSAIVRHPYG